MFLGGGLASLFLPARVQGAGEAHHELTLLDLVQPPGHAAPENPPFRADLDLAVVNGALVEKFPDPLHAMVVHGEAEAGPETETQEVHPADLVFRGAVPGVGPLDEAVRHGPQEARGPTVPGNVQGFPEGPGQGLRFHGRGRVGENRVEKTENPAFHGPVQDFRFRGEGLRSLFPELKLKTPAVVAFQGAAPDLQGSHLGVKGLDLDGDGDFPGLLPEFDDRLKGRHEGDRVVHGDEIAHPVPGAEARAVEVEPDGPVDPHFESRPLQGRPGSFLHVPLHQAQG